MLSLPPVFWQSPALLKITSQRLFASPHHRRTSSTASPVTCWADWAACAQFVYDVWYGQLTPDHDFPAEVRSVLNHAFGELAARARHMDVRDMLLL